MKKLDYFYILLSVKNMLYHRYNEQQKEKTMIKKTNQKATTKKIKISALQKIVNEVRAMEGQND
jgi:uncharacterized protein YlxW (UPF0749 family)